MVFSFSSRFSLPQAAKNRMHEQDTARSHQMNEYDTSLRVGTAGSRNVSNDRNVDEELDIGIGSDWFSSRATTAKRGSKQSKQEAENDIATLAIDTINLYKLKARRGNWDLIEHVLIMKFIFKT